MSLEVYKPEVPISCFCIRVESYTGWKDDTELTKDPAAALKELSLLGEQIDICNPLVHMLW